MTNTFSAEDPFSLRLLWIPDPLPLNTAISFPPSIHEDDPESISDLLQLLPSNCKGWKVTELLSSLLHLLCNEPKSEEYGYSNTESLAQGVAGKLRLAEHNLTGEKVVIKSFDTFNLNNLKMALREILLNALLDHKNLSLLLEVMLKDTSIDLVFRYQSGGDLLDYLSLSNHKGKRINEQMARILFRQILDAISWLHERGLVHRDIKPENILVDKNGCITIIDFGFTLLALPLTSNPIKSESFCGSLSYAAPEILAKTPYCGHSTDIWSLGITLYVLTTGVLPFEAPNVSDMFTSMIHQHVSFPPYLSSDLRSLLLRMLDPDPARRATLHEIQHAPWLHMHHQVSPTTPTDGSPHPADDPAVVDRAVREAAHWFAPDTVHRAWTTRVPSPAYATVQLLVQGYRAMVGVERHASVASFLSIPVHGGDGENDAKEGGGGTEGVVAGEMLRVVEEEGDEEE